MVYEVLKVKLFLGGKVMRGVHKFYKCSHCGNLAALIEDKGVPLVCCGEKMPELIPNTVDASTEKHVPAATVSGERLEVQVGSVPHPMTEEHHITYVYVGSENGGQRKGLKPGMEPKLSFSFVDDKPLTAYAYCNLHGLWKAEI